MIPIHRICPYQHDRHTQTTIDQFKGVRPERKQIKSAKPALLPSTPPLPGVAASSNRAKPPKTILSYALYLLTINQTTGAITKRLCSAK